MHNIWLVASREIRMRLTRPSFYLVTIGMPLLIGALYLGIGLVSSRAISDDDQQDVLSGQTKPAGLVDLSGVITNIPSQLAPAFQRFPDEAAAEQALAADRVGSYFVLPSDYRASGRVTRVGRQATFISAAGGDVRALTILLRTNLGADLPAALLIDNPATFKTEVVTRPGQGGDQVAAARGSQPNVANGIGLGFAFLLAFSLLSGGNLLLTSISEEKANRTMEILLTTIRPSQLLAGKLAGLGLIGLVQLVVWLGLSRGVLGGAQALPISSSLSNVAQAAIPPSLWFWAFVFFLLGYLLYGSLLAALAALGTSARESGQISGFLTLPVIVPVFWFGFSITEEPNGLLAQILSFFPLTAPTTLLLRLGVTTVPWWQLALAIGVLLLSIWGALAFAARLFRATTLLTGAKPTPRAILHALRTA